jgi:hypothetical protein
MSKLELIEEILRMTPQFKVGAINYNKNNLTGCIVTWSPKGSDYLGIDIVKYFRLFSCYVTYNVLESRCELIIF